MAYDKSTHLVGISKTILSKKKKKLINRKVKAKLYTSEWKRYQFYLMKTLAEYRKLINEKIIVKIRIDDDTLLKSKKEKKWKE